MGLCLIGTLDPEQLSHWLLVILQVAAGLGFVIFVHELGHFAVAKACGVKCDKFFLGFDIGGYKISRRWGETEYGIGILPLGGYVKMMGQDDNPANIDEQLKESMATGGAGVETKEIAGPDGKKYLVDKRSYLAKSVPQRMAIISAGVVMNIIFAFIFAVIAFKLGVPYTPSVVGQTAPGSPAWQADVRPDDEVVELEGLKNPSFEELLQSVILGDLESGIPFVIDRDGQRIEKRLRPKQGVKIPRVGISSPRSLVLYEKAPVVEESEAARAKPAFEGGDQIVAVDGEPVAHHGELMTLLAAKRDQPITFQVRRGGKAPKGDPFGPLEGGEMLDIRVEPRPLRTLGLVMQVGKVVAVQEGSPAAAAGIETGDFIDRITPAASGSSESGEAATAQLRDPLAWPAELARIAADGGEATLVVRSAASDAPGRQPSREITVPLRQADRYEPPVADNDPLAASSLGVAYNVLNVVASVEPDSPAAKAGIRSGDVITGAKIVWPEDMEVPPAAAKPFEISGDQRDDAMSWPAFAGAMQSQPEGVTIELQYRRGETPHVATLEPALDPNQFEPERGMRFGAVDRIRIAETWGEAIKRGKDETIGALGMVYRFLGKLGSQISVTNLGGPLTIAQAAGATALQGMGKFLTFLTMLSANLAVINFLPIPVLDGGHMAFLLWEGIRGKPAGEKFAVVLQTAGFVFIVSLMLFVFSLDIQRFLFT